MGIKMDTRRLSKWITLITPLALIAYDVWVVFAEATKHDSISRVVFNFNQDHPILGVLTAFAIGGLCGHWFAPKSDRWRWSTAGLPAVMVMYGLVVMVFQDVPESGLIAAIRGFPMTHAALLAATVVTLGVMAGHWIAPMKVRGD